MNLKNSFPEKDEKERATIRKKFYRYLCDMSLETFRTLGFSKKSALAHCSMHPDALKLFNDYASQERNVIIVLGHYGNWEWSGNAFSLQCLHKLFVIYHPLTNPYFDGLIYRIRSRFGTGLIPMDDTFREMVRNKKKLNATAFIADQTPSSVESAYWTTFLHQDTPVFRGTELIAKKMNCPVIYVTVRPIKRGVYQTTAELLCENPSMTAEGEISELHTRKLERDIQEHPEFWLWSHRRWKHKRK